MTNCRAQWLPVAMVVPLMQSVGGNNKGTICQIYPPSQPTGLDCHVGNVQACCAQVESEALLGFEQKIMIFRYAYGDLLQVAVGSWGFECRSSPDDPNGHFT